MKKNYYRVLVQEYIYGKDARMIEIIGCTTVKNSAIIIPAIIKKIREYPLNAGSTSYAMAVTDSEYIDRTKILNLIEKTQF